MQNEIPSVLTIRGKVDPFWDLDYEGLTLETSPLKHVIVVNFPFINFKLINSQVSGLEWFISLLRCDIIINDCYQTLTCDRDLRQEKCVESRINRLQSLVQNWSRLPEQVYFVSTLKGKVTQYLCISISCLLYLFYRNILQNL